jgi:hypothetical protein
VFSPLRAPHCAICTLECDFLFGLLVLFFFFLLLFPCQVFFLYLFIYCWHMELSLKAWVSGYLDLDILQWRKIGLKNPHHGGAHVLLIRSRAMSSVCWICVLIPPACLQDSLEWNYMCRKQISFHLLSIWRSPFTCCASEAPAVCNKLFFFGLSDDFAISCVSQVVLLSCEHLVFACSYLNFCYQNLTMLQC